MLITRYVSDLELLSTQVLNDNHTLNEQAQRASGNFIKLSLLVVSLYLFFIVFTVCSFSKYIV